MPGGSAVTIVCRAVPATELARCDERRCLKCYLAARVCSTPSSCSGSRFWPKNEGMEVVDSARACSLASSADWRITTLRQTCNIDSQAFSETSSFHRRSNSKTVAGGGLLGAGLASICGLLSDVKVESSTLSGLCVVFGWLARSLRCDRRVLKSAIFTAGAADDGIAGAGLAAEEELADEGFRPNRRVDTSWRPLAGATGVQVGSAEISGDDRLQECLRACGSWDLTALSRADVMHNRLCDGKKRNLSHCFDLVLRFFVG